VEVEAEVVCVRGGGGGGTDVITLYWSFVG